MNFLEVALSKHWGKIKIKGTKGVKVKVFFQGLHMTLVNLALVYNLKLCISNTSISIAF
jgi:hypothetical protein